MATVLFTAPIIICQIVAYYFELDLKVLLDNPSPFISTFTLSCSYAQLVFIALYLLVVLSICKRYKIINQILNQNQASETLKILSKLHLIIYRLISLTNRIFSTTIMISFGFNMSAGVFSLYELFSIYSVPNVTRQQIGFCFVVSSWWPSSVCCMIAEIWCCTAAIDEEQKTSKILKRILCKEKDEKNQNLLKTFLMQISHSRVAFSCGLFEFNWELLGIVS